MKEKLLFLWIATTPVGQSICSGFVGKPETVEIHVDRCREISRVIHVIQKSGFIGNSPGCSCLLLEIEIDQLLSETFQLGHISGPVHDSLKTLLLELLVERNFHPRE